MGDQLTVITITCQKEVVDTLVADNDKAAEKYLRGMGFKKKNGIFYLKNEDFEFEMFAKLQDAIKV